MFGKRFWRATRFTGLVVRELIGWSILLVGLNVFRICFRYLDQGYVVEGFVAAIVGVMLFRGGLQLIKVSVAARAMRQAGSGEGHEPPASNLRRVTAA